MVHLNPGAKHSYSPHPRTLRYIIRQRTSPPPSSLPHTRTTRHSLTLLNAHLHKLTSLVAMYAVAPNYIPAPADGANNVANPRWQMVLHNYQMQRKVFYYESAVADGPRHRETWTAAVYLTNGPEGKVIAQFTAVANTRQAAREEASRQALVFLGLAPPYYPA